MKITFEETGLHNTGKKLTLSINSDTLDLYELKELLRDCVLGWGYCEDSWEEVFEIEEHNKELNFVNSKQEKTGKK